MSAPILVTDDIAEFPANCFTGALTGLLSTTVKGTARFKVRGRVACLLGDERSVVLPCSYQTSTFTTPGAGTITIQALVPAQQSTVASSNRLATLLASDKFVAQLQVSTPASVVVAGVTQADPLAIYVGTGEFKSSNTAAKASK